MKVLTGDYQKWEPLDEPAWVTIGVFDGLHVGHQRILRSLRERAGSGVVGVVSFHDHPLTVLRPEGVPPTLTDLEQRLELFAANGVDVAAILEFTQVRELAPEAFVGDILCGVMNACHVTVGRGFRFGFEMAGDVARLTELGEKHGYTVEVVDIVGGDYPVRSTEIRRALLAGDLRAVSNMLGRPFQLRGTVVVGDSRGREIGFPTANLDIPAGMAVPGRGVYSAVTYTPDGTGHPSVVNVGTRPTFGGRAEVVEVHLLDGSFDLYGRQLTLDFVERIREERRFDGVPALVEQIERDVAIAKKQLAASR